MAYKNILVAVDLTDEADEVLSAARELANDQGAQLATITVIKPITQVYGGLDWAPITTGSISFETEAVNQATAALTELGARYDISSDDIHVVIGTPAFEIRRLAESSKSDLIVIGTHGRHGLGLLLGSTANAVLHGVQCDVLAIHVTLDAE